MKAKCPKCGEEDKIKKDGKRKNKYVQKQGYACKTCGYRFVEHDGFEGMTYTGELIVKVLHLYVEGLSLSKIRDYIYQHEGYKIYDGTILYWVAKYSKMLGEFERKQKQKVVGRIHMDEVELKVNP